ncbi:MAG: hypothetical protein K6G20_06620 [Ruminococcus sp.]|nr:hypothetical protein [Ruminococcus sp.]
MVQLRQSLSIGGHLGGSLIQKGYAYYCKVTDSAGNTLTSDAVRYDGNSVLTKVDSSNIKCVFVNIPTLSNGKISFEALVGIAPYTYEWHRLGREGVYGTTSSVDTEAGEAYYCIIKDSSFRNHSQTTYETEKYIVEASYDMVIITSVKGNPQSRLSEETINSIKEYYSALTRKRSRIND